MKMFLIRHGETDFNRQKRYQGRTDVTLNEAGLQQIKALSRSLSKERIDKIYTSNLLRAENTAHVIAAGRNIEIVPCEMLMEIDFGAFEGLTFEEALSRYPRWQPDNFDFTCHSGESLRQLIRRVESFNDEIKHEPTASNIAVVSHAGCLRVLICLLLGISTNNWWRFTLDTASLTILENVPKASVMTALNNVSHLQPSGAGV
ncbi:MAG: histidine phosphatase family protein [Dehalococcoidales bacterium]|nr:histidine phosphatase family protein [Dehalococcoidales bacterium]